MYKLYSIIVLNVTLALGTCSDTSESRYLGKEIFHLTQHSDSIQVLYLKPLSQDSTANYYLNYAVQDTSQNLTQSQASFLARVIKSKASDDFDDTVRRCTLSPDYALVFYGSNLQNQRDTLTALLDFQCDMWHFVYGNSREFKDMKGARDSLLALMNEVFPTSEKSLIDTLELDTAKIKIKREKLPVKDTLQKDTTKIKIKKEKMGIMKYDQVQSVFFKDLTENPHTTHAFILNPEDSVQDISQSFHGFAVVEQLDSISKAQQDTLLKIVKDKHNYPVTDRVKNCTFLPDVGYRVHRKDSTFTDVLIAFYCDDWMFVRSKERVILDSRKARKDLLKLTKQIFPKDAYFKSLD